MFRRRLRWGSGALRSMTTRSGGNDDLIEIDPERCDRHDEILNEHAHRRRVREDRVAATTEKETQETCRGISCLRTWTWTWD